MVLISFAVHASDSFSLKYPSSDTLPPQPLEKKHESSLRILTQLLRFDVGNGHFNHWCIDMDKKHYSTRTKVNLASGP